MHCPGSVKLTELVRAEVEEEEPDYRRDGVEAHALAAYCHENGLDCWEAPVDLYPSLTADMMAAVQTYLDFTRQLPGRERHVELRVHRPEFHELFYGTLDFVALSATEDALDLVDYKHGEGILVEVEGNVQLQYYAYGLIAENRDEYPDDMTLRIHICQPRAEHPAGPIRTWETRASSIRQWARETLLPAMEQVANDAYLSVGEWCRFCPAKLVCPAMTCLADELAHHERTRPLQEIGADLLGDWYDKAKRLRVFLKAIEDETERRALAGETVPGVKLVPKKAWRVWKEGVPLRDTFGDAAFGPKSPSEIAKLPDAKEFVAEWAFNVNDGKLTVALAEDRRAGVSIKSGAETFAAALDSPL